MIVISCDPCNECGEPLEFEPTVAVSFINTDSLESLELEIEQNNSQTFVQDSIRDTTTLFTRFLADSLLRIDSLVNAGNQEFLDEQESLNNQILGLNAEIAILSERIRLLDSVNGAFSSVIQSINSGLLLVDTVTILTNGKTITYLDSSRVFNLPLLIGQEQTDYRITIRNKRFSFSLAYDLSETVDDARVYRILATNIRSAGYTNDTLIFNCPNDFCVSNETSITAPY